MSVDNNVGTCVPDRSTNRAMKSSSGGRPMGVGTNFAGSLFGVTGGVGSIDCGTPSSTSIAAVNIWATHVTMSVVTGLPMMNKRPAL